mgnify:CR=1 FL=1
MVNNPQQWDQFSKYLDTLIDQQHRTMEQSDNDTIVHRAQGSIYTLRRLKLLRDEVLKNGG